MRWSFGLLGVARGIKGSGTGLTFDPLRLFSGLIGILFTLCQNIKLNIPLEYI